MNKRALSAALAAALLLVSVPSYAETEAEPAYEDFEEEYYEPEPDMSIAAVSRDGLFSDDFENGSLSQWTSSSVLEKSGIDGFGEYSAKLAFPEQRQISKVNLAFYGSYTVSYDVYLQTLVPGFYVDMIRNRTTSDSQYKFNDRLMFEKGTGSIIDQNLAEATGYYVKAGQKYHVEWHYAGTENHFTVTISGVLGTSADDDGSQMTVTVIDKDIPDKTMNNVTSPYSYTVGTYFVANSTKADDYAEGGIYLDNVMYEADGITVEPGDFGLGDSSITFKCNQFIDKTTKDNIVITRGGEALAAGTDYSVSYGASKDGVYCQNPTVVFNEPVTEAVRFDFTGVNDSYGRSLEYVANLPATHDSLVLAAAYDEFSEQFNIPSVLDEGVYTFPQTFTSSRYPGETVNISYSAVGRGRTSDYRANETAVVDGGTITVRRVGVDDITLEPQDFDASLTISASLSYNDEVPRVLSKDTSVMRDKILERAVNYNSEIASLCDGDNLTGITVTEPEKEYIIELDAIYPVGRVYTDGTYSGVSVYYSVNGGEYTPAGDDPFKADRLKIVVTGSGEYMLSEVEPLYSSYFDSYFAIIDDFEAWDYTGNLTGLTKSDTLLLPSETDNGTRLVWSSDSVCLDVETGAIRQKTSEQTVTLTVMPLDAAGKAITACKKTYTAVIAAKSGSSMVNTAAEFSDNFESGSNSGWTNYTAEVVPTDIEGFGDFSARISSTKTRQLSKTGLSFYGSYTIEWDVYMDDMNAGFYVDVLRNGSGAAYQDRLYFSRGTGKLVFDGADTGYYGKSGLYHVRWVVDGINKTYTIYVSGRLAAKQADEGTDYTDLCVLDNKAIPETTVSGNKQEYEFTSGITFIGSSQTDSEYTGCMYIDNVKISADDFKYTLDDFPFGATELKMHTNHYIPQEELQNIVVTDGSQKLIAGTDYSLSYEYKSGDNVASPIFVFTDGINSPLRFNLDNVRDSYGRPIGGEFVRPITENSQVIIDALEKFDWKLDPVLDKPEYKIPTEFTTGDGKTVVITPSVSGGNGTDDEQAAAAVSFDGAAMRVVRPEITDITQPPENFDITVAITLTFTYLDGEPLKLTQYATVPRRKLMESVTDKSKAEALCDGDSATGWTYNGEALELVFDKPYSIGHIYAEGKYGGIKYYYTADGKNYEILDTFPVEAIGLKVELGGIGGFLSELEPVTSSFYDSVIAAIKDFESFEYTQNLSMLTNSGYLTLPTATPAGTRLQWSVRGSGVNQYGAVTQTSSVQTAYLTVCPLDPNGDPINGYSKTYTATVAAKAASSGGSSGGGGGGGGGGGSVKSGLTFQTPTTATSGNPESPPAVTARFGDLREHEWARDAVEALAKKGIIDGKADGVFAPDDNITREEFVKLIIAALNVDTDIPTAVEFTDVPSDAWYMPYINAASANGIITGISDTEFGAGRAVTREDIAVIMYRAAAACGYVIDATAEMPDFTDKDDISDYADEALGKISEAGIITGYEDNSVRPKNSATRAETAVMVYRLLINIKLL